MCSQRALGPSLSLASASSARRLLRPSTRSQSPLRSCSTARSSSPPDRAPVRCSQPRPRNVLSFPDCRPWSSRSRFLSARPALASRHGSARLRRGEERSHRPAPDEERRLHRVLRQPSNPRRVAHSAGSCSRDELGRGSSSSARAFRARDAGPRGAARGRAHARELRHGRAPGALAFLDLSPASRRVLTPSYLRLLQPSVETMRTWLEVHPGVQEASSSVRSGPRSPFLSFSPGLAVVDLPRTSCRALTSLRSTT